MYKDARPKMGKCADWLPDQTTAAPAALPDNSANPQCLCCARPQDPAACDSPPMEKRCTVLAAVSSNYGCSFSRACTAACLCHGRAAHCMLLGAHAICRLCVEQQSLIVAMCAGRPIAQRAASTGGGSRQHQGQSDCSSMTAQTSRSICAHSM